MDAAETGKSVLSIGAIAGGSFFGFLGALFGSSSSNARISDTEVAILKVMQVGMKHTLENTEVRVSYC
jgi:hypothetical protein